MIFDRIKLLDGITAEYHKLNQYFDKLMPITNPFLLFFYEFLHIFHNIINFICISHDFS